MKKIIFKNKPELTTPINAFNLNKIQDNIAEELDKKIAKDITESKLLQLQNDIDNKQNELNVKLSNLENELKTKDLKAEVAEFKNTSEINTFITTNRILKNGNCYCIFFKNERKSDVAPKLSVDGGNTFYNIKNRDINVSWEDIKGTVQLLYFNDNNFYIFKEDTKVIGIYQIGYALANDDIPFKKLFNSYGKIDDYLKLDKGKLTLLKDAKLKISCNLYVNQHAARDAGYIWLRLYKNRNTIAGSITSNYGRYSSLILPPNIYEFQKGDVININLNNSKETLGYTLDDIDRSSLSIEVVY